MSGESRMQRGAREANEENRSMADSRKLGEALGLLAGYMLEIQVLRERVASLEARVDDLDGKAK